MKRAIARFLVLTMSLMALTPRGIAWAGNFNPTWVSWAVGGVTTVNYPNDDWQLKAQVANTLQTGVSSIQLIQGNRWITTGNESAGMLGISSDQISNAMRAFPANLPIVFAQYSPNTATLRIDVIKVEKTPDGYIKTYGAQFTPWHGEKWKAQRAYLSDTEKLDPTRPGLNPFEAFKGADTSDEVFHNIGWPAAQMAIGHAMRFYGAGLGLIAMYSPRMANWQTSSGNVLRKTVTSHVAGYTKPNWFIAAPVHLQPRGQEASICVVSESPCQPYHVALSGISVENWKGGNLPINEDQLYYWEQSKSSWTVVAFAFVICLAFAGGWAIAANMMAAGGGAIAGSAAVGGAESMGAWAVGGMAGGAYAAGTMVFNGGSITSAQNGLFGSTGDGVMTPPVDTNQYTSGLTAQMANRINGPITGSITGVTQMYDGTCGEGATVAQCQSTGQAAGNMPRPDDYINNNTVQWMQNYGAPIPTGVMDGVATGGMYIPH